MNARRALHDPTQRAANYVDFSNDKGYICVSLEDGFALFQSDPCELYVHEELPGSIGVATMLGNTQVVGLISGGDRPQYDSRRLSLYDIARHQEVATIKTMQPIIRARLSTQHIAIAFERSISLYKHKGGIEKIASYETVSNPLGLACLGEKVLVIPGRSAGQLQIIELSKLDVQIVPAHSSTLRAIELAPDESIVASASDKGTLVRIYSTYNAARLAELRRGVTPATILSLTISPSNDRLALTSDTNTLHIFDIPSDSKMQLAQSALSPAQRRSISRSPTPEPPPAPTNKWGSLSKLPFAPRILTDTYSVASCQFNTGHSSSDANTDATKDARAPIATDAKGAYIKDSRGRYKQEDEEDFVDIVPGVPGGSPPVGVAAWIDDERIVIVSAGKGGLYERYVVGQDGRGGIAVGTEGWCNFLSSL